MKRIFAIFLPGLLLATNMVNAMDEESSMKYESDCHNYAMEDSILPEDMDAYIEECVRNLTEAEGTSDLSPSEDMENQE